MRIPIPHNGFSCNHILHLCALYGITCKGLCLASQFYFIIQFEGRFRFEYSCGIFRPFVFLNIKIGIIVIIQYLDMKTAGIKTAFRQHKTSAGASIRIGFKYQPAFFFTIIVFQDKGKSFAGPGLFRQPHIRDTFKPDLLAGTVNGPVGHDMHQHLVLFLGLSIGSGKSLVIYHMVLHFKHITLVPVLAFGYFYKTFGIC